VQFVIVAGTPNATLISCVREPHQLLADPSLRLNLPYYITKQIIPALNRALTLVGDSVNALRWYKSMPRRIRIDAWRPFEDREPRLRGGQRTLSQFFASKHCALCGELSVRQLCARCLAPDSAAATAITMQHKAAVFDQRRAAVRRLCLACTCETQVERIACASTDCPVFFQRIALQHDAAQIHTARRLLHTEF
jgi:DNA polymerase zeta